MNILNNKLTTMSLGSLNKNISQASSRLAKLASGAKINGAADGAADFAISQKMQVRIRALAQDSNNVHNGMALLNVAMGGVQEQINLMKYVKERVLDAANDSNSDLDRMTIQKEINSCFETINQIACESADYNKHKVLHGGKHYDWMVTWQVNDDAKMLTDSDLGIIPNVYDELDGVQGPFDLFEEYKVEPAKIESLGIPDIAQKNIAGYFTGGKYGKPNQITVDFSPYGSVDALDGVGFAVGGCKYVLSTNPADRYKDGQGEIDKDDVYIPIDISQCSTTDDVANAVQAKFTENSNPAVEVQRVSGSVVTFVTKNVLNIDKDISNATTVTGTGYSGYSDRELIEEGIAPTEAQDAYDEEVEVYENRTITVNATNCFPGKKYLSGGVNAFHNPFDDVDATSSTPPIDATLQADIYTASSGSGFTIHGLGDKEAFIILTDGNRDLTPYQDDDGNTVPNVYCVGKEATWEGSLAGLSIKISAGQISFTATNAGASGNACYISDGFTSTYQVQTGTKIEHHDATPAIPGKDPVYADITYKSVTPLADKLADLDVIQNLQTGTNATHSTYTIDLSSYVGNTNPADLQNLINDLYGKSLAYTYANTYEFMDSSVLGLGTVSKFEGSTVPIDLNSLRSAVANGTDIATAMAELLTDKLERSSIITDANGNITGVQLESLTYADTANDENISGKKGYLRSYVLDFQTHFSEHAIPLPDGLYGKGFRVYCPTDSTEWFNFVFMPRMQNSENTNYHPDSGTDSLTIKSILIDVSEVTDASSLVSTIYQQAEPVLTGAVIPEYGQNTNYNHHLRVAANPEAGELILYDDRRRTINYPADNIPGDDRKYYVGLQSRGEKIADGAYDNVELGMRELYCEDIIIHHTDKANMNIHLKLPRTTIDHILGFDPSKTSLSTFNVLTKKSRDYLLGTKNSRGVIDMGINYLTNAETLLGAQYNHLESANSNINTTKENTIQSESTISDANMAKEAMEHAKYQILSQSSQAMLAQANQVASSVLNLLQ